MPVKFAVRQETVGGKAPFPVAQIAQCPAARSRLLRGSRPVARIKPPETPLARSEVRVQCLARAAVVFLGRACPHGDEFGPVKIQSCEELRIGHDQGGVILLSRPSHRGCQQDGAGPRSKPLGMCAHVRESGRVHC